MTEYICPICGKAVTVIDMTPAPGIVIGWFARTGHFEDRQFFRVECGCLGKEMRFTLGPFLRLDEEREDWMKKQYLDIIKQEVSE